MLDRVEAVRGQVTMRRARKYQLRAGLVIAGVGCAAIAVAVAAGALPLGRALLYLGVPTLVDVVVVFALLGLWTRPLAELSRRMSEVRRGEAAATPPSDRDDEIGDLARHFSAIVEGMRAARAQSLEIGRQQASIEKFAALGRLSAGVAHEINNPVGGILTCLETMRTLEPGSERYEEYLTLVRSGLERIGSIVKQLLSFSRQPTGERQDVDLNAVIREVTILSAFHDRDQGVEVVHEEGDLPVVNGHPDLLNQLFLNLVLNALQAMPDGGTLRIRTEVDDGGVVAIFEDTGPGIPEEHLDRIFEPFFTTKEVGVGTGLGLSVALGVVEAHGGSIQAENLAEGGVRFTVRIPSGSPVETIATAEAEEG